MTIEGRVAAGVALLNEKRPGWAEEISLRRLTVAYYKLCVLGQLYGTYDRGCRTLKLAAPALQGFISISDTTTARNDEYSKLQAEWERVIRARQAEAV